MNETQPTESTQETEPATNGEVVEIAFDEEDTRYFYLAKPIQVGDRKIDQLLLDPKELGGRGFFAIVNEFRKTFPEIYRVSFNLYSEVSFLSMVIAKLNKITREDLYKLQYDELPILFLRASSFHYSGGRKPPVKTEKSPTALMS